MTGLDLAVLDDLETIATGLANTGERAVFWSNVVRLVEGSLSLEGLSNGDETALNAAIAGSDMTLSLSAIVNALYVTEGMNQILGSDEIGMAANDNRFEVVRLAA